MTSFGDVQYPQYPSLDTVDYDDVSHSRGGNMYHNPVMPIHENPYMSSGTSGYGDSPPIDYGPPPYYPSHMDQSSTGYGGPIVHAPSPPSPPPPPTKPTFFGGFKKAGNSALGALTLLSFLFFVNMLQNCLKDHMDTMNPTVMVMTNPVVRHSYSKLTEMNSREQSNSPDTTSVHDHIVEQSDNLNVATTATYPPATISATLSVVQHNKVTTESVTNVNDNSGGTQFQITPATYHTNLNQYESNFNYSNRNSNSYPDRYRPENYYNDRYRRPYYEDTHHWSHHRPYGHRSSDFYWDHYENRNFPNHDFYDDAAYLRIY